MAVLESNKKAVHGTSQETKRRSGMNARLSTDRELAEIHAQVPTSAGAAQRQRNVALGHHGAAGRRRRAGMRATGHIGSEDLVDVEYAGELADAFDLLLAEGQATAPAAQVDRHVLAVAAGDAAGTFGFLVKRRPAVDLEPHLATDFAGGVRIAGVQKRRTGEQRGKNEVACDVHDGLLWTRANDCRSIVAGNPERSHRLPQRPFR